MTPCRTRPFRLLQGTIKPTGAGHQRLHGGKDARKTKGSYERALNRLGLAYSRINKKRKPCGSSTLIASDNSSAGYYDNRREVRRALGHWGMH